ncbi:aminopeptidase M1 [Tasmannia lanceolata]|uniref:aminopeptidase M1 n=1 Tax=Tasmannia lanceolata TaxID=3420 RepID=UPI00406283A8
MEQFKGQARLPKFAIPKRYELKLKPDLSACKFTGTLEITVDIVGETKFIVLNAADLSIQDASISFRNLSSNKEFWPSEVVLVEQDEILVLGFYDVLPLGDGILTLVFAGTLNDQMKGFYRSTYELNGEKKNMAVTQFEPADARRCFPCWDEPDHKATFKIELEIPYELIALSNMPVIQEKVDGCLKTVTFQESPIMSTYLVAVVIGLFDYVEDFTPDGTPVRVYCQIGKVNQGKFALDVAVKTLDLYKRYFSTPYSLPKLDMIAIPDFAAGAMENYGLVTYRETALLYDDRHSAAANKQRVAIVVAHELAHQWFGNLVTMEWWTHLWLNEGFATWVSYLATDSLFPEWKIWTQFLDQTTEGLRLDGLAESHPIEVEVNHAREIDEIFDSISYMKGASVIRMLQSYLGAESFQRSLALYIKRYACSNAKTDDLWDVLEEESGEPVNMLMSSWTKQQGYPVVYVKINDNMLEFEQSQFLSSGSPGDGQWIVPLTVCFGSYDTRKNLLLRDKFEKLDMGELMGSSNGIASLMETSSSGGCDVNNPKRSWVKLNVDQTGFYRVKYDDELAVRLRLAIEANCLTATDKYGVLDDSYALCMACKQTLSSLFSLMDAYREEHDYTVLSRLISVSSKVAMVAADAIPELSDEIKQFFINLLHSYAGKLGWEPKSGESHLDAMLRGELLTVLAVFGHDVTQAEAVRRFYAFLDDRNTTLLPADTRKAAYVAVMQTVSISNKSGYESLLRVYRETDLSQEKVRVLGSLASCPDPDIVLEVLKFLMSSEVRSQDAIFGLAGINREGRETAWRWLKDNWDHILKTFGSGFLITRFISAIVSPFSSEEKAHEVKEFFASRTMPSIKRTLKQSIERIHINAKWVQSIRNEESLREVVKELAYRKY